MRIRYVSGLHAEAVAVEAERFAARLGQAAKEWSQGRKLDGTETFRFEGRPYDVVQTAGAFEVWPVGHAKGFYFEGAKA